MHKKTPPGELSVIEQTRDLILWYVPLLNRLPRDHRFTLGERIINSLYELLEELIRARYAKQKLAQLEASNLRLELLRQQARLLLSFKLIDGGQYQHLSKLVNTVGQSLGSWIKQQHHETTRQPVAAGD
ncbi:MAG: diversity-generating retroelement protein Avd [Acidobacteria bacterium]|nr:diversity-generating retroelement protein Avd [Acidobacteriota bacterium]MBI3427105.1 diversity-generating retroelement protein Avd [Acidobacteriota bacterium]